jgi:signal transduction histidine kinase
LRRRILPRRRGFGALQHLVNAPDHRRRQARGEVFERSFHREIGLNSREAGTPADEIDQVVHRSSLIAKWGRVSCFGHSLGVTFGTMSSVSIDNRGMPIALKRLVVRLDPRRSLATAMGWLIISLSLGLAAGSGFLAGHLTRSTLLEQRSERAENAAEQWSAGLDAALAQRRQPLQTAASMLAPAILRQDTSRLDAVFADLRVGYPEFTWVGLANREGRLLASTDGDLADAGGVAGREWFREGMQHSWIATSKPTPGHAIHLSVPVVDPNGATVGVIAARLDWSWLRDAAEAVRARVPMLADGQAFVVDASDRVVIGPPERIGSSLARSSDAAIEVTEPKRSASTDSPANSSLRALGWRAVITWPAANVTRRADTARLTIVWLSLVLGLAASIVGVFLARRLTRRLTVLSNDVLSLKPPANRLLDVPPGSDEVSQLGASFNRLLASLQNERRALTRLTSELEARVQARTAEVERLADESRYAAVVRERLRIARDLHDTLAHSMMEMLAEVRILRKLHTHDPDALSAELERAEQVARDGLREARGAITQMRFNGVRDLGLGPALGAATALFSTRTGIEVACACGPRAANFGDSRAVAMFRIAEEALRNIEQHARASRVMVSLQDVEGDTIEMVVSDDGIGFDMAKSRPGHYGLVGLREQSQLINATLSIVSAVGEGTTVTVRLKSEASFFG